MYFYNDGNNEVGPLGKDQLAELLSKGLISEGTLVRPSESTAWVPFAEIANDHAKAECAASFAAHIDEQAEPADRRDAAPDSSEDHNQTATPDIAIKNLGWTTTPPAPWRRFAARSLDSTLNGFFGFLLLVSAFYAVAPATADSVLSVFDTAGGRVLDILMTGLIASIIGGALIGVSGSTFGKIVFGIRVTTMNGKKLGLLHGMSRDFAVLIKGLGLGMPLIVLVTMWVAYGKLTKHGTTSWDKEKYLIWQRPNGTAQYLLNFIGILMIIGFGGLLVAFEQI